MGNLVLLLLGICFILCAIGIKIKLKQKCKCGSNHSINISRVTLTLREMDRVNYDLLITHWQYIKTLHLCLNCKKIKLKTHKTLLNTEIRQLPIEINTSHDQS